MKIIILAYCKEVLMRNIPKKFLLLTILGTMPLAVFGMFDEKDKKTLNTIDTLTIEQFNALYNVVKIMIDKPLAQKLASYITPRNIHLISLELFALILKTDQSLARSIAQHAITEDSIKEISYLVCQDLIDADASCADLIAKNAIKKNNIKDIQTKNIIHILCKTNKSLAYYFASLIDETNFTDNRSLIGQLVKHDATLAKSFAQLLLDHAQLRSQENLWTIVNLVKADASLANILSDLILDTALIDETTMHIYWDIITHLLHVNSSLLKKFIHLITKNNIHENAQFVSVMIERESSLIKIFATLIDKDNIKHNAEIIKVLVKADSKLAKTFAQLAIDSELITRNTINDHQDLLLALGAADTSVVLFFAQRCIDKDNLFQISLNLLLEALKASKEALEYISSIEGFEKLCKLPVLQQTSLEIMLFDPKKTESYITRSEIGTLSGKTPKNIPKIVPVVLDNEYWITSNDNTHLPGSMIKKGQSWQHYNHHYRDIAKKYTDILQNEQVRYALFKMLQLEWNLQDKGLYTLYHNQNIKVAMRNMVTTRLLELYYNKSIDKEAFFAQRWGIPGTNLPYDQLKNLIINGDQYGTESNREGPHYKHMQFANGSLFGNTGWNNDCSFDMWVHNRNYQYYDFNFEELFKQYNLEKYYKKYQHVFDALEELAHQCKRGVMLIYSLTPQAMDTFVYATHCAFGYKTKNGKKQKIIIDGKNAVDWPARKILDALRENPKRFDSTDSNFHQYVILMSDDHKTDNSQLGSCNPFNKDLRCYHIAGDHQVSLIEKTLDKLFAKIAYDIKNDKTVFLQKNGIDTLQSKL